MLTGMSALPQCAPIRLAQLRADLQAAGFFAEDVDGLLGDSGELLAAGIRVPAQMALAQQPDSPLKTLVGLFVLGLSQPVSAVAQALPQLGEDGLKQLD